MSRIHGAVLAFLMSCSAARAGGPVDFPSLVRQHRFTHLEHSTLLERVPAILAAGLQVPRQTARGLGGVPSVPGIYFSLGRPRAAVDPIVRFSRASAFDARTGKSTGDIGNAVLIVDLAALSIAPFHISDSWNFGRIEQPGRGARSSDPAALGALLARLSVSGGASSEVVLAAPAASERRPSPEVSADHVLRIEVHPARRERLIELLRGKGIRFVNDVPIEELVVSPSSTAR